MNSDAATLMIDSGIGGLSVLSKAHLSLPDENICFFADAANAPYGDKKPGEIRLLLHKIIDRYQDHDIKAILLACNTATSAAAAELRSELKIPVIGMEPALKPAVQNTTGQVVVMATSLTIREKKFRDLLSVYGADRNIVPLGCPGLMELVEKDPEGKETEDYLMDLLSPYKDSAEAIVLGCTHYVFLRKTLSRLFPAIKLFDGNEGVTKRLSSVLGSENSLGGKGNIEIDCSLTAPDQKSWYLNKCAKMIEVCDRMYIQHQPFN